MMSTLSMAEWLAAHSCNFGQHAVVMRRRAVFVKEMHSNIHICVHPGAPFVSQATSWNGLLVKRVHCELLDVPCAASLLGGQSCLPCYFIFTLVSDLRTSFVNSYLQKYLLSSHIISASFMFVGRYWCHIQVFRCPSFPKSTKLWVFKILRFIRICLFYAPGISLISV